MFWSRLAFRRKTALLLLIIGSGICLFMISVSGHSGVWTVSKPNAAVSSPPAQGRSDRRLEVEVVEITPDGFEPQQLERTAGPFILSVTNRSGIDSLNIQINNEQQGRFREKSLPLITPYWRERINPPPGKYVITEENHPEWTLTFIIK